ncbi:MAG: TonB-dependent receptor [Pseudomonadales bacterium]
MCSVWHKKPRIIVLAVLSLTLFSSLAFGYSSSDEELSYLYGDDDFVSIATGHKQRIAEAPAVASVITAQDIRAMGATDLDQVLEAVPGLHVSVAAAAYNSILSIRGVHSSQNAQTLVLVNGFPITNSFAGNRGEIWGGMPVEMISRIEVIRGPGSALYGADALAGVINIITKNADDIDGLEAGVGGGSFDTQRGWLLYGGRVKDWKVGFGLEVIDTGGQSRTISADAQTLLDPSVSLAPGSVNTGRQLIETRLDLEKDEWRIRLGYQGRKDVETGAGINQALDPDGRGSSDRLNLDVTYKTDQWIKDWDISNSFSYFDTAMEASDVHLLPAGAFGSFPNGVIGDPKIFERHYRYDMSAFFTGFDKHQIRIGSGYHYLDLYRIEESKNFTGSPPVLLGSGTVQTVKGSARFNRENERQISYVFVQDEWRLAQDWSLVTGLRYDHYSDFGGTVNPRLALVWTAKQLTTKFLYGSAFRAPSFAEQFNQNNPVAIGNSDLDPEVIDTYEVAFDYAYSPDLRLGLNLFYYEIDDIIRFAPRAINGDGQTGKGFEFEVEWQLNTLTHLVGNFSYQRAEDEYTYSAVANTPQQQVYLRLDRQLASNWHVSGQLNSVMNRKRAAGDNRAEIDDYTTLDITLKGERLLPGVTLSVSVFNLADADVREPGLYDALTGTVAIPDDLPLAGRSFLVTLRKRW